MPTSLHGRDDAGCMVVVTTVMGVVWTPPDIVDVGDAAVVTDDEVSTTGINTRIVQF